MSSWIDKIHPASFRGVKFSVKGDKAEFGRATVRHDFPGVDSPLIEDIGKLAREFTVDAFIVGDDYAARRDNLIAACETPGSGVLSHPYYGRMTVTMIGKALVSHQSDEGRICVISMQFVRTPNIAQPLPENEVFGATVSSAGRAMNTVNAGFQKAFSVANRIGYVVESARAKLGVALSAIRQIKKQARKLSEFSNIVGRFMTDLNTLMLAPSDLVYSLHDILSFNFGGGNLSNPYNLAAKVSDFYELRELFGFGDDDTYSTGTSLSDIQDNANLLAINTLVQHSAVIVAARCIVDIQFASANDALVIRDIVISKIDSIMETTDDDDLYLALIDLKSNVVKNIEVRAINLSIIQSYEPTVSINSLVLSHKLYGNLSREQDIITRNKIQNPAFIPGGVSLEVLSV